MFRIFNKPALKVFVYLCFFFSTNALYSQQKELASIDSLLQKSDDYVGIDDLASLEYAKKASLIAEKTDYSEKKAITYLYIAKCLHFLGSYKESFNYIEKGLKEKAIKKNMLLYAQFKEIKALNYCSLNISEQELQEYFNILRLPLKNDDASKQLTSRVYSSIGAHYFELDDYNNAKKYIDKSLHLNKSIFKEYVIYETPDLYNIKGQISLKTNQRDTAYYYFKKALDYRNKYDANSTKYVQLSSFGDYYYETKEYSKSLDFFLKTLEDMKKNHIQDLDYSIETNQKISELYGIAGDKEKENYYLTQCQNEREQLQKENNVNIQAAINTILNEKQTEQTYIQKKYQIIIVSIALLLLIFLIIAYRILTVVKCKNAKAINEKEKLIEEKVEETAKLAEKADEKTFNELIALGKANDPQFLILFEELYPHFISKLKKLDPKIRNSELSFCALTYLNFSNKDIAQFTYVTVRAIETRKSRLRKKYNIPADEHFNTWMKNLENN